jgi:hypothetical protein
VQSDRLGARLRARRRRRSQAPAFGCYILSHMHPDETVCECAGLLTEGAPCEREYQCVPGLEC